MRDVIEFGLEVRQRRTALPGARRVARLGHEPVNHAVEDDAVVKALADQGLDPLDMARRPLRHQPDQHPAAIGKVQHQNVFRLDLGIRVDQRAERRRGRGGILFLGNSRACNQGKPKESGGKRGSDHQGWSRILVGGIRDRQRDSAHRLSWQ